MSAATSRALALRSSFQTACRRPVQSQLIRPLGRMGYASAQGKAAKSSDMPWNWYPGRYLPLDQRLQEEQPCHPCQPRQGTQRNQGRIRKGSDDSKPAKESSEKESSKANPSEEEKPKESDNLSKSKR
ncbi:hypothetical protein B0T26DRAFT_799763 [Lasiosphaeria miniovina]|uniref:Uncharacterized protein n=1 Tax=Lasiosphaeria miniovina TaxID=1954250 RepID=A0AA40B529_9PEZI|nr:uncharacterized protein B0T26DRAFT_799763 [Lasiosphaeria miniovina]KAK0727874.1 hypothetical protein B0T26DRAFT_799763 [Lasiosphaeria miniovina]